MTYLYFIDTLYRYLESIDIFITTTLIKGGDDILYHRELNYIIYLTENESYIHEIGHVLSRAMSHVIPATIARVFIESV